MFALLEHDTTAATGLPEAERRRHWDLLVETPGQESLPTWRLAQNPLEARGDLAAERVKDHRRLYLDFEGEVSGGRGVVRRLDRGPATLERMAGDEVVVQLAGRLLCGRFELAHTRGAGAVFRRV